MTQYYSQNGWPCYTDTSHWTKFTVAGRNWWGANNDVAVLFTFLIEQYNERVEPVIYPGEVLDDWSGVTSLRPIRGQTHGYSNHDSATAIDVNATRHPRGVTITKTFTTVQIATIQDILNEIVDDNNNPVIRWGGNYITAEPDGMHYEINVDKATATIAADRIRMLSTLTKADIEAAIIKVLTTAAIVNNRDSNNQNTNGWFNVAQVLAGADQKTDYYVGPRLNALIAATTELNEKLDTLIGMMNKT